jgi:hypothetical protein
MRSGPCVKKANFSKKRYIPISQSIHKTQTSTFIFLNRQSLGLYESKIKLVCFAFYALWVTLLFIMDFLHISAWNSIKKKIFSNIVPNSNSANNFVLDTTSLKKFMPKILYQKSKN